MGKICIHCGQDVDVRNPSGYCDHLYYPKNCKICQKLIKLKKQYSIAKNIILDQSSKPLKINPDKEPITNMKCSCKKRIGKNDTYFIRFETGEMPEVFCDHCIEMNL